METAIYGRVSTEEQAMEGYSIRGQVEKLKSYISAKSWSIYDVYLDEGISGKNMTERPAITRMMEDIKAGHVKNVLVFKLDRLTRSVADLVYLIDLFKNYGCAFNSLSESIDTSTASGRMFIKIIGIFAEFERENIGERVRLGKERKAKEGFTTACPRVSYGYQREKGEKVQRIDPTEAAIVRRIFNMYVNQNMSLTGIAITLNHEKIPSKQGNAWNTGVIINLLKNCNYIGYVRYGTESPERYFETEGKHEAIISEELFREAQLLMEKNKYVSPTKKPKEENYFSGLLHCGLCGKRMVSHITYSRGEIKKPQYNFFCTLRNAKACDAKKVSIKKLEKAFIEYFSALNIEPDIKREEKEAEAKRVAAARIEELRNKIITLDAKEKEMLDSYIEDNASLAEYRSVKVMLDSERERIIEEIKSLTPPETSNYNNYNGALTREEIISALKKHWQTFTDIEKRQFLLKYIKRIDVINHPVKGSPFGNCEIVNLEYNMK